MNSTEQVAYSTKFSGKQELTHPVSFFKMLDEEQTQGTSTTTILGAANDLRQWVSSFSDSVFFMLPLFSYLKSI